MDRIDLEKAKAEQLRFAEEVITRDIFDKIKFIAGTDEICTEEKIISVISVYEYPSMKFVESKYTIAEINMPFISGYRAYREMKPILETYDKLKQKPDLLIVDSHGILHPRRFGMASHIGLILDIPTIGIAKKLMVGKIKSGKVYVEIDHRGFQLISKENARPIYISPGHKISIGTAFKIIKDSIKSPHKMPEPMHAAHKFAAKLKKK